MDRVPEVERKRQERRPDEPTELKISSDETWGVIVFPTGELFANQLY